MNGEHVCVHACVCTRTCVHVCACVLKEDGSTPFYTRKEEEDEHLRACANIEDCIL